MTATTFDATTAQAAPRRSVEDAWRTLNQRYAIGTGVLVALLALLPWTIGIGPWAERAAVLDAAVSSRTAQAPATAASGGPSAAGAPSAAAGASGSASAAGAASTAQAAAGAGSSAAGAASTAPGASSTSGTSGGTGAPARDAASAAATPRPVAGTPVARLYFEPDQAWPTGEVGPRLAPVLARLKAEPDTKALVSGFHDRRGSAERNEALALRRAQAVRRVLVREGVATERIVLAKPQQTTGSGPDREARRVEVTVAR
jgi:outer membrane protein OmpA-like peptidoglycan-associated protein